MFSLLLADERIFVLGFGFEDDKWEALLIQQQEIDVAFGGFLEVFAKSVEVTFFDGYLRLKLDISG